jgi:hypothetical protein
MQVTNERSDATARVGDSGESSSTDEIGSKPRANCCTICRGIDFKNIPVANHYCPHADLRA